MKKSIIYNLLGTIFDKGLPLLISIFLTKYMTSEDYGRWSLFYAFLLIAFAFGAAPVLTFFSRNFHKYQEDKKLMYLYFHWWVIVLQIISILVYYCFFVKISLVSILEIPTIIFLNIYSYIVLFYRFKGQDKKYMIEAGTRLVIFIIGVLLVILINSSISFDVLIGMYILSHIPSLLKSFKSLSFKYESEPGGLKEFFYLSSYGLVSSLITSLDRLIIVGLGLGFSFLGFYSFIYTVANTPSIIVEALKKTVNPTMYKDLNANGKISNPTKRLILKVLVLLLLVQVLAPFFLYYLLTNFNLINSDFLDDNAYFLISILSVGLFFVAIYQLISPYYFFFKKTKQLLIVLLSCLLIYIGTILAFYKLGMINIVTFSISKSMLLCLITIASLIIRVKK